MTDEEMPRAKRRRLAAAHVRADEDESDEETMIHIVVIDPTGSCKVFPSRRKARKYARRHRREIEAAFDY